MRYELKPFLDATFQTDTGQELFAGHSLGGLLSLYTLFTQPDLFEKFIAASPSAYWDEEVIYGFEEAYYAGRPSEHESLFMSVGTHEDPFGITLDYVSRLGRQIRDHGYENLTFGRKRFRGHNHSSVVVNAYAWGTRFVFQESATWPCPRSRETAGSLEIKTTTAANLAQCDASNILHAIQ